MFFDFCVAQALWSDISEIVDRPVSTDFESVAKLWLSDKKFKMLNVCTCAVLWTIWKTK
jgi:hypothetical protein